MSRRGGRNKTYDSSPEPEIKRSSKRTSQQPSTSQEAGIDDDELDGWSCSVCTYRNNFESFKCEICESRKGTSTRKPRLNPSVVQQQTLVQLAAVQQQSQLPATRKVRNIEQSCFSPESNDSGSPTPSRIIKKQPRIKKDKEKRVVPFSDDLIFRSNQKKRPITVRGITFVITEYKPKRNVKSYRSKKFSDK